MSNVTRDFSTGQAQFLAGLTHAQINYWANNGVFIQNVQLISDKKERRKWHFREIIGLSIIAHLREVGIPLPALRTIISFLNQHEQTFDEKYLLVRGTDIVIAWRNDLTTLLSQPGKLPAVIVIDLQSVEQTLLQKLAEAA